jgi:hypothetical protein
MWWCFRGKGCRGKREKMTGEEEGGSMMMTK